jgi:hypothetical protein
MQAAFKRSERVGGSASEGSQIELSTGHAEAEVPLFVALNKLRNIPTSSRDVVHIK